MNKTPIEWTDFTVNPFRFRNLANGRVGHYCEKISPGCKHCYSGTMQKGPYLSGLDFLLENFAKGELFLDPKPLHDIVARKKACKVFWCDMTDMFLDQYPFEWIDQNVAAMVLTPHITHQVLSKRTGRMLKYFQSRGPKGDPHDIGYWMAQLSKTPGDRDIEWPPQNIVLGASVEDQQRADERRPHMRDLAAAGWNTFVSYEPALGAVDWTWWDFLKWGIVGGESGRGAREFEVEWARNAVAQWRRRGIAPFVKQMGSNPMNRVSETSIGPGVSTVKLVQLDLAHPKGGDMTQWPADLQFIREYPVLGK